MTRDEGDDMIVADLTGSHEAHTLEDLESLLALRHDGGNEFRISAATKSFPCLAINIRDDVAVLHFLPKEGHPEFQSGSGSGSTGGMVSFAGGTGDAVEVPDEAVVPVGVALAAAVEFAASFERPNSIRWVEL